MSPPVNLLDWRSVRRQQAQQALRRQLQLSLLAALLLQLAAYGGLQQLAAQQSAQQRLLQTRLQEQQRQLQAHYHRAEQVQRWRRELQQLEQLRRQREWPGLWLDALQQDLPPSLHWSELQQSAQGLLLKGQGQSAAQLSDYVLALQQNAVFAQVQLQAQQSEAGSGEQHFVIKLQPAALAGSS